MRNLLYLCLLGLISQSVCETPLRHLVQCGTRECVRPDDTTDEEPEEQNIRTDYEYHGSSGFKLHIEAKNWTDARQTCNDEGAHLAVINSKSEYRVLQGLFKSSPPIKSQYRHVLGFVGLHDIFEEGEWYSIFDEPIDEVGWSTWDSLEGVEQPDNGNGGFEQDCGALVKGGYLDDMWCFEKLPFFCEILKESE